MEENLIELVKQRDLLYNVENPSYKDTLKKEQAWKEIAEELDITAELAKKRWKTLRDTYNKAKHAKLRKAYGSSTKIWKYWNRMSFLDDVRCSRIIPFFKTGDPYEDEQQDDQYETEVSNDVEISNEADFEMENCDLDDSVKKIDTTTTTTSFTNPNPTYYTVEKSDLIHRKKYDKEALIEEACNEMTSMFQNAKKHFTPPSSNQVFFNSLALQVDEAQLPDSTQMRLQQRILELVTLEICNYQENECVYYT